MNTQDNTKNTVSIDELAVMVAKGFRETNTNLFEFKKEVGVRFDRLESRVTNIEENMATKDDIYRLEKRFDGVEKVIFSDHGRRLRKIETKLQIA